MKHDGLIHAWLNGDITKEGLKHLEKMLREQPDVRRRYRELVRMDATLRDWAACRSMEQEARLWLPAVPSAAACPKWYARNPAMMLGLAACIASLMAVAAFVWGRNLASVAGLRQEESSTGFAVLTRVWDAEFAGRSGLRPGDTLKAEKLSLLRGFAQIEFFSGASVIMEGEAELELRSAWEATCTGGKVRVRVPPPARGFRLLAPGVNLVDLGTEFGLNVDGRTGMADVHVFDGEVEAHPEKASVRLLKGGEGVHFDAGKASDVTRVNPEIFASVEQFDQRALTRFKQRFEGWRQWTLEARSDPRLVAFYLFDRGPQGGWDRQITNFTEPRQPDFTGGAVGAHWTQGRWPMKDALEFKGPGDRVRINLGVASHRAISMVAWVRVDGIDRKYNALMLTDGYDPGEPHWQIYEDGALMFSIAYADTSLPANKSGKRNQIYFSPPVFTLANQRRWHQIAVTYDSQTGEAVQFVDGREISREVSRYHQKGRAIVFGPAEIGNWGMPTEGHQFPIRNLNGRIDEFAIYSAVLSPVEIQRQYDVGKPD